MDPVTFLLVTGLLLILVELLLGVQAGFDLILIGTILLSGRLVGRLTSFQTALILIAILAFVYIAFGRKFVKKQLVKITRHTNVDKLPGQKGVVVRSITPDTAGMVRLSDEDWRAESEQVLYEKDKIVVESVEGVTLKVKKSK